MKLFRITSKFSTDYPRFQCVNELFRHRPISTTASRAKTNTFIQNRIGNVLLTFENEAFLITKDLGSGGFDEVVPSINIEVDQPIAINEKVVAKKNNSKLEEAYF